ncbi:MAG: NAD(P)/FAD-dependent oxidoreductase [Bacteroidetes bacterium]|nr:NAD(P)/FAD-dependent oxidoreductase [Bacteroidota bacterium]
MKKEKIVIIGGGFGGLNAAKSLKKTGAEITLIDKTNHHLFQPLLYQVAAAALSPGDIATPIRGVLRKRKNIKVIMEKVISIDRKNKKVILKDDEIEFDYLIVAVGSRHSYFGNDQWENFAPGLKTISDALKIREKMLYAFEKAEVAKTDAEIDKYLTFVIVGGGPTGVELAGAIAEISKKTMRKDFRRIDPSKTKIILVEGENRILTTYDNSLSKAAEESLKQMGVNVLLNRKVTEINSEGVQIGDEFINATNVFWAAGNQASPLLKSLNTEQDRAGRIIVDNDCSIKDDANIFIIGDAANFKNGGGKTLPGIAPVAIQQGKYVADIINKNINKEDRKPFKYFDKGTMATIGRAKAVLQIGKFKASGFFAWLTWVFVHIMYLIGFRNRYMVMSEWVWHYINMKNGIRLITNKQNN